MDLQLTVDWRSNRSHNLPSTAVLDKAGWIMRAVGFMRCGEHGYLVGSGSTEGVSYSVTLVRRTKFTATVRCNCPAYSICAHMLVCILAHDNYTKGH